MDREQLKQWLDEGLSLEKIGGIVDRHPSTVGYWVRRHGLKASGHSKYSARGALTREQLAPLVEEQATLEQMAQTLDRSVSTIRYWLKEFGLQPGNRPGRTPVIPYAEVQAAIDAGKREISGVCTHHGETIFVIENSGRTRCRKCRMERVAEWRRRAKRRLVEEAGGCCQLCGYDRCMAALEFHHLDPGQKSFALSLRGITRSFSELRREAAKCALLCANCHAEVENGYSAI